MGYLFDSKGRWSFGERQPGKVCDLHPGMPDGGQDDYRPVESEQAPPRNFTARPRRVVGRFAIWRGTQPPMLLKPKADRILACHRCSLRTTSCKLDRHVERSGNLRILSPVRANHALAIAGATLGTDFSPAPAGSAGLEIM